MCTFFFAATLDCCSDTRKSFGPSAPIAYATSVSPPDEAVAWPWAQVISNFESPNFRKVNSPF